MPLLQPAPNPPVLLTVKELAARWRVTTDKVRVMKRAGKIPFVLIGCMPRFRLADIERIETPQTA